MLNSRASNVPNPHYTPLPIVSRDSQRPVYPARTFANNVASPVFTANDPYLETDANYMPQREPLDARARQLAEIGNAAYDVAQRSIQPPLVPAQCQDSCLASGFDTTWNAQFLGCPTVSLDRECRMYRRDPRLWQADLNEAMYERNLAIDADLDPYKHHNRRQSWLQFLSTDWQARRDQYMRPINSFEEAFCLQAQQRYGEGNRAYPVSCVTKPVTQQNM
jgi:hypothetical protein